MAEKNEETKKVRGVTPLGIAVYPRLTDPDTKFKADGEYHVKLKLAEKDAAPIIDLIDRMAQEALDAAMDEAKPAQKAKLKLADKSYEHEYDDDGNETGYMLINFKMAASGVSKKTGKRWTMKPTIFDARGQYIKDPELKIYGGSKIKISYELAPFTTNIGSGVSHRLLAVQVIELSNGNVRDADFYGFAQEDGYEVPDEQEVPTGDAILEQPKSLREEFAPDDADF